ncbi:hypothetical protein ACVIOG_001258 [Rhizobium leguminosarum]
MANTDLQINRPDDLQDLNVISPEPAYNPKSRPFLVKIMYRFRVIERTASWRTARFNVHRPKVCSGFENMHT